MKLMQRVADVAGRRRLARNTIHAYSNWIQDFLRFCRDGDHLGRFLFERSRRRPRVPTVLSVAEVARILEQIKTGSTTRLMVELMYGAGLRAA
jgi:site-specific recombinase XerD